MTGLVVVLFVVVVAIWMIIPAIFAGVVASEARGNTAGAILLGLFVGWIGVVIVQNLYPRPPVERSSSPNISRQAAGLRPHEPAPSPASERGRKAAGLRTIGELSELSGARDGRPDE